MKLGNTEIVVSDRKPDNNNCYLVLHDNAIAIHNDLGEIWIRHAGHKTQLTKERLSAIPGIEIKQKDGEWYLNGELWDDLTEEWKFIREN